MNIELPPSGFDALLKQECESLTSAATCNNSTYACEWDTTNNKCAVLANRCPLTQQEYNALKLDFQRFAHVECCRTFDASGTHWEYALAAQADCNLACAPHTGWVKVDHQACITNGKDWDSVQ